MTAVDLAWHLDRKVFAQTISFIFQCFLILALGTQGPSWLTEGPQRAKGFSDRLPVCDHSQWHDASLPPMWEKGRGNEDTTVSSHYMYLLYSIPHIKR